MSAVSSQSYYDVLGVLPTASDTEIKTAYKKKVLDFHPDRAVKNGLIIEKATAVFKLVNEAHEVLSNPTRRQLYDMKIRGEVLGGIDTPFEDFRGSRDYSRFHCPERKSEDDRSFFPKTINEEITTIIDSDNSDSLDQILRSNHFENSLLKSILYHACRRGKFNVVKYLIEVRKLSAHLKVDDGLSFTGPIFKAAAESGNLDLVRYLFEVHHVDIESQGLSPGTQNTALSRAALQGHEDVVKYLISKGAALNPDVTYKNILNCAICSKKLSVVRLLVEAGTKIGDFDFGNALEKGVLDIVQDLLEKRPGLKAHKYISSPACLAVKSGNVALVKFLEKKENLDIFEKHRSWDDSIDLLMRAAAQSHSIEMMRFLLDEKRLNEKVSINLGYIQSILSEAVRIGCILPSESERLAAVQFVQFLMEERRFVLPKEKLEKIIIDNAQFSGIEMNSYLQSYLCNSVQEKELLITIATQGLKVFNLADLWKLYNSKMIKKGMWEDFSFEIHCHIQERKVSIGQLRDFFLGNKQNMTDALFYYSSCYFKDDISPLKLLLELGVDLNAENAEGLAAIHVALNSGGYNKIFQFYVENKADLSKRNKFGKTAEEILTAKK